MLKYDENVEHGRYGIKLASDQVIRKEYGFGDKESFELIQRLCNHFINHPDPMVVPVLKFETLEEPKEGRFGTFKYAYEMKRLFMLTHEEKDIIETCIRSFFNHSHDLKANPDARMQRAWRDNSKLVEFMQVVLKQNRYNDLHSGNFLKDENEDYKIIDLEGFMRYPANGTGNDWITQ
jgi:hypothetical protein